MCSAKAERLLGRTLPIRIEFALLRKRCYELSHNGPWLDFCLLVDDGPDKSNRLFISLMIQCGPRCCRRMAGEAQNSITVNLVIGPL